MTALPADSVSISRPTGWLTNCLVQSLVIQRPLLASMSSAHTAQTKLLDTLDLSSLNLSPHVFSEK